MCKKRIPFLLLLCVSFVFSQQKRNINVTELNQKEIQLRELKNKLGQQQTQVSYNLANTIYKSKNYKETKYAYKNALASAKTPSQRHKIYHNLGNVYMQEKQYDKAVESYKNALKNNPKDEQTRYNLALAQRKLKQNPSSKNTKKNKQKNKDKNKSKDSKNKDKNQQNSDKNQSKSKPKGVNKQHIENILNAIGKEEKKVQEKANAQRTKTQTIETDKDW